MEPAQPRRRPTASEELPFRGAVHFCVLTYVPIVGKDHVSCFLSGLTTSAVALFSVLIMYQSRLLF